MLRLARDVLLLGCASSYQSHSCFLILVQLNKERVYVEEKKASESMRMAIDDVMSRIYIELN